MLATLLFLESCRDHNLRVRCASSSHRSRPGGRGAGRERRGPVAHAVTPPMVTLLGTYWGTARSDGPQPPSWPRTTLAGRRSEARPVSGLSPVGCCACNCFCKHSSCGHRKSIAAWRRRRSLAGRRSEPRRAGRWRRPQPVDTGDHHRWHQHLQAKNGAELGTDLRPHADPVTPPDWLRPRVSPLEDNSSTVTLDHPARSRLKSRQSSPPRRVAPPATPEPPRRTSPAPGR